MDSKLDRFKLIVKPDLSDASLHVINTPELTHNFENVYFLDSYRICEDTLVSVWCYNLKCGVYTGFVSSHFPDDVVLRGWVNRRRSYSLCPASGRLVYHTYVDDDGRLVVFDLI